MAEIQVQHESLLLPGYWRIAFFGKLTENPRSAGPDLRIQTFLTPLAGTTDKSATESSISGQLQQCLLPVGEIPRLHLNAILHDGQLVAHRINKLKQEQIITRTLDCRRNNIRFFQRFERDEYSEIIPVRDKWAHLRDDPELHGLFLGIGTPEDPYATVIPAVEIFRFFYATSDVLAKAFLKDHFLDPNTNLWNVEKTGLLRDGKGVIWLRKKMLDADASFLARFAFDNYALRQAQRIFLDSSATGRIGGERTLWAAPPFEDIVRTKLMCVPIGGPNGKRMLVTRLITCDWKPPWIDLNWDRDNDARYDPDEREKRGERDPTNYKPNLLIVPAKGAPKKLANVPPSGASVPARLKEEEICERFPEIGKIRPKKLPIKNAATRAKHRNWLPIAAEAYPGSVIEGRSSEQYVGRTIIEGLKQKPQAKPEITDKVNVIVGQKDYRLVLNLLQAITNFSLANVKFTVVLDAKSNVDGVEFNVFPSELDGKKKAWLYVDENRANRRMVLLASVEHEGRWRYIIELQQKRKGECATLVVWDHEERPLPPGFMVQLVMDCARENGTYLVSAKRLSVIWGKLRHTTEGTDEVSAQRFLQRILMAKPEAGPKNRTVGKQ